MSDLIVYFPATDIEAAVAAATKRALMNLSDFFISEPGFSGVAGPDGCLDFPHVGVDWRTVSVIGISQPGLPIVITPNGLVARYKVVPADVGKPLSVADYKRYSTYMLASIDDIPTDLFTWFGDVSQGDKVQRTIPIMVPLIRDAIVVRQSGRGETASVIGYLCVYAGAAQGGTSTVKSETAKFYNSIKANANLFTAQGMTQLLIDPPKYSTYSKDSVLYEGMIPFSCVVRLS